MKILKTYTLLSLMTFVNVVGLKAQTHADATSQKWKGIDVSTVIGNDAYPDDNTLEHGYPFLLYNVGTGRFIMQGGDWAMEGRLFFSDFGRTMYLYSNGRINAAITESQNVTKNSFCARPPEPFNKNWSDANYNTVNLTTLMDGDVNLANYPMNWTFERVEDVSNTETYTYYMYQTSAIKYNKYAGQNFYLGAAWGECHNASVGKGDGRFVFWDDDRSCWTTANVIGNTETKELENGDKVEIQKLYQWRLISLDKFIEVLNTNGMGLNPSISSLIKDRDFTRNANDFYGANDWTVSTLNSHTYGTGTERYTYTWGDYRKGQNPVNKNNQQSISNRIVKEETWDSPVRLKEVFDAYVSATNTGDQASGKKNAKYGFMIFEGVGTVTTNFVAPNPGWYEIECAGFSMSEQNHDAYLFARVIPDDKINNQESTFAIPTGDEPTYGKVTLGKLPYGTYQKDNYENCLEVGKELLINRDEHRQKVWVLVSQEDFDADKKTIRLGFRKDEATQSEFKKKDGNKYAYYDTDWVCVDDIRASYMGLSPVFFYEDEEDLRYLSHAEDDIERFTPNEYAPAVKSGRYGGSANLQRKFTKDEWNTFSFPLPLTGEQIRNAFGDDSELLILNSIGNLSSNDCIIDFETVNLLTTAPVVTAGNLYMLKPTKEPAYGEPPRGEMAFYYDLGKFFFSTNGDDEDPNYNYPVIDLSVWNGVQEVGSYQGTNDGVGHVTYTQTPGFESFRVTKAGIYNGSVAHESSYAPKGSYAMSGGKMYELSRDTRIKGFRGWITLTHSIFDDPESSAAGAKIAIDGIIDGEVPTVIDRHAVVPVIPNAITAVYDLSGRKVGTSIDGLPKGMYIVGGKKLLVK